MMRMILDLENKKEVPEEIMNKKIFDLHERFGAMEDFKLDKDPLWLNDDVNYDKDNPSKTVAVMDPKTGCPKFVLKYHGGYNKLYDNEDIISKFHDYGGKRNTQRIPWEVHT